MQIVSKVIYLEQQKKKRCAFKIQWCSIVKHMIYPKIKASYFFDLPSSSWPCWMRERIEKNEWIDCIFTVIIMTIIFIFMLDISSVQVSAGFNKHYATVYMIRRKTSYKSLDAFLSFIQKMYLKMSLYWV